MAPQADESAVLVARAAVAAAEAAARAAEAAAAVRRPRRPRILGTTDKIWTSIAETARAGGKEEKAADEAAMSLRVLEELQGKLDTGIRVNSALARLWGVRCNYCVCSMRPASRIGEPR